MCHNVASPLGFFSSLAEETCEIYIHQVVDYLNDGKKCSNILGLLGGNEGVGGPIFGSVLQEACQEVASILGIR
jgi:hypothetical protein